MLASHSWRYYGVLLALAAAGIAVYLATDMALLLAPLRSLSRLTIRNSHTTSSSSLAISSSLLHSTLLSSIPQPSTPRRTFTSTANMSHTSTSLKDAVVHRRTIYQLNKKAPVDDKTIEELFRLAIKEVPSSFNSQSARIVVLLKDDHDAFWDIVRDILKAHVPEDKWEHTGQRIEGFRKAYGTVRHPTSTHKHEPKALDNPLTPHSPQQALFYEDPAPIKTLQTNLPAYADKFPQWSEHTSAMHQYFLWTALEAEGFGCNLQHYNPLPDQKAAAKWNIPLEWSLKAQLVFGGEEEGARAGLQERSEQPIGERLFIHGAAK